jgi:transcriptional regulator with XRE-family HTH domain
MSTQASPADSPDENFQGLVLRYRGRTGLTQRQLAERLGVHTRSVQAWESGVTYPNAESLQALITSYLECGGFSMGREASEARALWDAAQYKSARLRAAFDGAWFADVLARYSTPQPQPTHHATGAPVVPSVEVAVPRTGATHLMCWAFSAARVRST